MIPGPSPTAEAISIFDMLKIGIGPSSSHTLGPWRAIQRWIDEDLPGVAVTRIRVDLFGSLALTGRGHHTDTAIILALAGEDPVTIDVEAIDAIVQGIKRNKHITLHDQTIPFAPDADIVFHSDENLPEHPNGLRCVAWTAEGCALRKEYFSIGGGFVLSAGETQVTRAVPPFPYPAQSPRELLAHCEEHKLSISDLVWENEKAWRSENVIRQELAALWAVMLEAIFRGCYREGTLPGGLNVVRRAPGICRNLLGDDGTTFHSVEDWLKRLRRCQPGLADGLRWLSCFALAVNEENASLGRVVTAPTNGAAGVIPAVLLFHMAFNPDATENDIRRFLLVAGEIATHFKKGATISAAMGGCQAEIGVSSAMAAAALTEVLGGSVRQCLMAAEVAMEHHLGLTCDPVGGLVQIPCIERNTMGAVKAVNAAQIALVSDPVRAKVSLDDVIRTMNQTAQDMSSRYKETSQAGLAVNISVGLSEC